MVRKRTKNPKQAKLDAFIEGADSRQKPDPGAKRDYKSIRVGLNEYEYNILTKGARTHNRSMLNYIRWAIISCSEEDTRM